MKVIRVLLQTGAGVGHREMLFFPEFCYTSVCVCVCAHCCDFHYVKGLPLHILTHKSIHIHPHHLCKAHIHTHTLPVGNFISILLHFQLWCLEKHTTAIAERARHGK